MSVAEASFVIYTVQVAVLISNKHIYMTTFSKKILGGTLALALLMGGAATALADNNNDFGHNEREARSVGSTLEVHITNGGKVLVRGAQVTALGTNSITATTTWGGTVMTWTVNTDGSTKYARRFGGNSGMSEIAVGDYISFQGSLTGTGSNMTVLAKNIKDWSEQKKNGTFEGTVSSISGTSFVLASKNRGDITVNTSAATTYKKGDATGSFADIVVGGTVTATGLYNNQAKTVDASKITVKVVAPQAMTKEGTVKSIAGTTAPTTFVLTANGTDYTVKVATTTSILTNNWLTSSLTSIAVNHNVRVYGVVNADNTIDATVVRDTNL